MGQRRRIEGGGGGWGAGGSNEFGPRHNVYHSNAKMNNPECKHLIQSSITVKEDFTNGHVYKHYKYDDSRKHTQLYRKVLKHKKKCITKHLCKNNFAISRDTSQDLEVILFSQSQVQVAIQVWNCADSSHTHTHTVAHTHFLSWANETQMKYYVLS